MKDGCKEGCKGCLIAFVVVVAVTFLFLAYITRGFREHARGNSCLSNQKQIALSFVMYAQEHDNELPGEDVWSVLGLSGRVLKCPSDKSKQINSYGYNAWLAGRKFDDSGGIEGVALSQVEIILTADANDRSGNLIRSKNDIAFRHGTPKTAVILSYVDGHTIWKRSLSDFAFILPSRIIPKDTTFEMPKTSKKGGTWKSNNKSFSVTTDKGFDGKNRIVSVEYDRYGFDVQTFSSAVTITIPINEVIEKDIKEILVNMAVNFGNAGNYLEKYGLTATIYDSDDEAIARLRIENRTLTFNDKERLLEDNLRYRPNMGFFMNRKECLLRYGDYYTDGDDTPMVTAAGTLGGKWNDPKKIVIEIPGFEMDYKILYTTVSNIWITQLK